MDFATLERSARCRSKWMQCDACGKWRRLPRRATTLDPATGQEKVDAGYLSEYTVDVWADAGDGGDDAKTVKEVAAAGGWVCSMNPWDPLHNSCNAPQDVALSTSYYFDTYVDYTDPASPSGRGASSLRSADSSDDDGVSGDADSQRRWRDKLMRDPALFRRKLDGFLHARGLGGFPQRLFLGGKPLSLHAVFTKVLHKGGFSAMNRVRGTWSQIFHELENYSETMTSASNSLKNTYQKYLLDFERSLGTMEGASARGTVTASWDHHKDCLTCTERVRAATMLLPGADSPTAVECRFCKARYHLRCLSSAVLRPEMQSWACDMCRVRFGLAKHTSLATACSSEAAAGDTGGVQKKARLDSDGPGPDSSDGGSGGAAGSDGADEKRAEADGPGSTGAMSVAVDRVSNEVLSVSFL